MPSPISLRLSSEILEPLNKIATLTQRPKAFLIKKALEKYIEEYADYQIALDRLRDKDDEIISSKQMRERLGLQT